MGSAIAWLEDGVLRFLRMSLGVVASAVLAATSNAPAAKAVRVRRVGDIGAPAWRGANKESGWRLETGDWRRETGDGRPALLFLPRQLAGEVSPRDGGGKGRIPLAEASISRVSPPSPYPIASWAITLAPAGASSSGKTRAFDARIRRFESFRPNHQN